MGDVVSKFLAPIRLQFPLPKSAEKAEKEFLLAYLDELSFYSDTVLEFAAKKLIASRDTRTFPLVAECVKICRDTHNEMGKPAPRSERGAVDLWSEDRRKLADKLLNSDLGRRAADENWHWELWDWMRVNQRWPNGQEAGRLKAVSLARNSETSAYVADQEATIGLFAGTRKVLGDMSRRRKELREVAYGLKKAAA